MKLPPQNTASGKWLDKKVLKTGDKLKITSEAKLEMGQNGEQLVAKVRVSGNPEEGNVAINKPSRKALVEVYGDDTINWVDKVFTAYVEKTRVGGQAGIALYFVPEGYEAADDENGYLVVRRLSHTDAGAAVDYPDEEINPESIPF